LRYGEGQGWRWGLIRAKKDRIIGQGERNAHNIAQRMFDSIWLLLRRVCKATGLINHNRTPVGMERRTGMILGVAGAATPFINPEKPITHLIERTIRSRRTALKRARVQNRYIMGEASGKYGWLCKM